MTFCGLGGNMSATRKSLRIVALILVLALGGYFVYYLVVYDRAASPELSKPPALLTQIEIGDGRLLFDRQTTDGWKIEGVAKVVDDTLVLGGEQAATAYLVGELGMEFKLRFDFFQEGAGKAEFRMKPVLLDPKDAGGRPQRDAVQQLNLSSFVYKRWHRCQTKANHDSNHFNLSIDVQSLRDGNGLHSGHGYGFPTTAGCRCVIGFEVGPGSKLYLRNVVVDDPAKGKKQH